MPIMSQPYNPHDPWSDGSPYRDQDGMAYLRVDFPVMSIRDARQILGKLGAVENNVSINCSREGILEHVIEAEVIGYHGYDVNRLWEGASSKQELTDEEIISRYHEIMKKREEKSPQKNLINTIYWIYK